MGDQVGIGFANVTLSIATPVGTTIATMPYPCVKLIQFATIQAHLEGVADGFGVRVSALQVVDVTLLAEEFALTRGAEQGRGGEMSPARGRLASMKWGQYVYRRDSIYPRRDDDGSM